MNQKVKKSFESKRFIAWNSKLNVVWKEAEWYQLWRRQKDTNFEGGGRIPTLKQIQDAFLKFCQVCM